jgi:DNA mismatch repair protein MutH
MSCTEDAKWKDDLLDFLWTYHPKRLSQIAEEIGVGGQDADEAKNYGATVVEGLVASAGDAYDRASLTTRGVTVKTVRMPEDGRPYESMSFPAFDHYELSAEEWETSQFRNQLSCLLIITLYGRDRATPLADCVLGHAFFWSPEPSEEAVICEEWTRVRDLINRGRIRDIPTEANTKAIHVRPHGRDSYDVVPDVRGRAVVRSSLWLNKDFVLELVRANR